MTEMVLDAKMIKTNVTCYLSSQPCGKKHNTNILSKSFIAMIE